MYWRSQVTKWRHIGLIALKKPPVALTTRSRCIVAFLPEGLTGCDARNGKEMQ